MTIDVKQATPRMLAALVAGSLASIQPTTIRAEDGAQLVDDFHAAFGKHRARANHAKGVILEGFFVPTDDASALSKAAVFAGPSVPVTIRILRLRRHSGYPRQYWRGQSTRSCHQIPVR